MDSERDFKTPEEVDAMTDAEYEEYLFIEIEKGKQDIQDGKFYTLDEFLKKLEQM